MPIYLYRCECGHRFERLRPLNADAPACPQCGRATRKIPAGPSLGGRAAAGRSATGGGRAGSEPSTERLAPPWRRLKDNPDGIRREVELRQRLEANHAANQTSGQD